MPLPRAVFSVLTWCGCFSYHFSSAARLGCFPRIVAHFPNSFYNPRKQAVDIKYLENAGIYTVSPDLEQLRDKRERSQHVAKMKKLCSWRYQGTDECYKMIGDRKGMAHNTWQEVEHGHCSHSIYGPA